MADKVVRTIKLGEITNARTTDISKYKDHPYVVARWIGKVTGITEKAREDGSGTYMMLQGAFAVMLRDLDSDGNRQVVRSGLMICPEPLVGEIALQLADERDEAGAVVRKGAAEVRLAYDVDLAFNAGKGVPYTFQYRPLFAPETLGVTDPLADLFARVSQATALGGVAVEAPLPAPEAVKAEEPTVKSKK